MNISWKNILKCILGLILFLGAVVFLISQIRLKKDRDRNMAEFPLSTELKVEVAKACLSLNTPEAILDKCSAIACGKLSFSAKNDIKNGKANCIGYARLTSALINRAFQEKNYPYRAKVVVGRVFLFGINLNYLSQKILPGKHRPFFKDHDFVEICMDDKIVYVDTSLQDLSGLDFTQTHSRL